MLSQEQLQRGGSIGFVNDLPKRTHQATGNNHYTCSSTLYSSVDSGNSALGIRTQLQYLKAHRRELQHGALLSFYPGN